jgi:hypothetical protein
MIPACSRATFRSTVGFAIAPIRNINASSMITGGA